MGNDDNLAPELEISHWLNTLVPVTLAGLRGKVVMLHAFQMLCPGCVQIGIPQAQKVYNEFDPDQIAVIGLHTVFEHHDVMDRKALEVFVYEYRLRFPIGIDKYAEGQSQGLPLTMRTYQMQGTPTTILIDRAGHVRLQKFGHISDLALGLSIGTLLAEKVMPAIVRTDAGQDAGCGDDGCRIQDAPR